MTTKTVTIPIKLLNDNDISVHEAALTLEYPEGLGVAFLDGLERIDAVELANMLGAQMRRDGDAEVTAAFNEAEEDDARNDA